MQERNAGDAIRRARAQDDVDAYMKKEGTAEAALEKLQRLYSAIKFIEQRLTQKKTKLKIKLPEIEKTYTLLGSIGYRPAAVRPPSSAGYPATRGRRQRLW